MPALPAIDRVLLALAIGASSLFGGCSGGGGGGSVGPPTPIPTRILRFLAQPEDGLADRPFQRPVQVALLPGGGPQPGPNDSVTIRLEGATTGGLRGTLTRPLLGGVATFDDLVVEQAGRDLTLVATLEPSTIGAGTVRSLPFQRGVRSRRHVILMVADGWGYQHIAATRSFTGKAGAWAGLPSLAMTTWDDTVRQLNGTPPYDPRKAWSDMVYLASAVTDSASAATAMYTGAKTSTGQLSIGPARGPRLQSIAELAQLNGLAAGAVTSVPISHATPGAWFAHNESRGNYREIGDEMLFGEPAATGPLIGSRGPARLLPQVLIGGGHPLTGGNAFITQTQWERAAKTGWTVVDRFPPAGPPMGSATARLLQSATTAGRLFGLFGGPTGNIPLRMHDGSGLDPAEPTLADMTRAALINLARDPDGFCVVIEGGAIDWASHGVDMSGMLGEMIGFDEAVAAVLAWIEDPTNGSDWSNTLLIVTGDHETGLLTAGPGVLPDRPLGAVTDARIRAETIDGLSGLKASWDDANSNGQIDLGGTNPEQVYWAWNTQGHSNTLVPCYYKGLASDRFAGERVGDDPVRGTYIDNTALFRIMVEALAR